MNARRPFFDTGSDVVISSVRILHTGSDAMISGVRILHIGSDAVISRVLILLLQRLNRRIDILVDQILFLLQVLR